MRQIQEADSSWPADWLAAHACDRAEFWGDLSNRGYTYAYQRRFALAIEAVKAASAPPARVLDIAAAQGNFSLCLAELGYRVTWNDLRAGLVDYVKLKFERGDINYSAGNIFESSVDEPFDVVLAAEVIEHVAHPDNFLSKLSSLVTRDGVIILTTPCGNYFRNTLPRFSDCPDASVFESTQFKPGADGHIFLLHVDEVYGLASKAGLRVERFALYTNPLTAGHIKLEFVLRILPRTVVDMIEAATSAAPVTIGKYLHTGMLAVLRKF